MSTENRQSQQRCSRTGRASERVSVHQKKTFSRKKYFYITFKMLKMDRLKSKHPDNSKKSFNKTVILLCDTSGQKDWNFNPIISVFYLIFENALETLFQVLHSPMRPYQLKSFDCFVKLVTCKLLPHPQIHPPPPVQTTDCRYSHDSVSTCLTSLTCCRRQIGALYESHGCENCIGTVCSLCLKRRLVGICVLDPYFKMCN